MRYLLTESVEAGDRLVLTADKLGLEKPSHTGDIPFCYAFERYGRGAFVTIEKRAVSYGTKPDGSPLTVLQPTAVADGRYNSKLSAADFDFVRDVLRRLAYDLEDHDLPTDSKVVELAARIVDDWSTYVTDLAVEQAERRAEGY